jgi:hypothetical protein
VVLVALLYEKSDTSLRAGNDTDGLFHVVSIFAFVWCRIVLVGDV